METHTSVTSWGEFTHTIEDVLVMFRLPVFEDKGATDLVLFEAEERKVQLLNAALKIPNKSTYTSWIRCDEERG